MILELFVNFCILFTFAMLMYWFARQRRLPLFPYLSKYRGVSIGLLASLFGIVLMLKSIHIGSSIIIDGRMAVVALSGLFGGPVAPIISGTLIGATRILMNDITTSSVIAGVNTIVIGMVIGFFAFKYPITFKNAWKYFLYTTIQTMLVIFYLSLSSGFVAGRGVIFALYALISFAVVYLTLMKMDQLSHEIDQIEQYSVTDYLTGLANTRKFQEVYFEWMKSKPSFYLAIVDIDHFKRINDTYGHPIGDVVLVELARRLERKCDLFNGVVSRIGGEEFAVLISADSDQDALQQVEGLRKDVEETAFFVDDSLTIPITISAGIANYPKHAMTLTELYKIADDELYRAKAAGRNRVMMVNGKPTDSENVGG